MKNVKSERQDINLGRCGSLAMYSVEYKCTIEDTNVTTQHITTVKESKKNPQSTFNISELIHGTSFIYTQEFSSDTSQKAKRDMKKVSNKQVTVTQHAPGGPSFRPNNPAQKDPISGKKINNKYIRSF